MQMELAAFLVKTTIRHVVLQARVQRYGLARQRESERNAERIKPQAREFRELLMSELCYTRPRLGLKQLLSGLYMRRGCERS